MKSIIDTLRVIKSAVTEFEKETEKETFFALIGGYAVIFHGVERTTLDVDACFYSFEKACGKAFYSYLHKNLPDRFKVRFVAASRDPSDPLKHDIIVIDDAKGEYPRIDILTARYKWELEGLKKAEGVRKLSFPVMPLPYLAAMKLQAGGRQDELDVLEMLKLMSKSELEKVKELAGTIGKDRKLQTLLKEADF